MHRVGPSVGEGPAVACLSQWITTLRLNRVSHTCGISHTLEKKERGTESRIEPTRTYSRQLAMDNRRGFLLRRKRR